jgi:hypothetical protein
MFTPAQAVGIIAIIFIVVVMMWLGREVVCWYLKINERKDLLIEIRDLLKKKAKKKAFD